MSYLTPNKLREAIQKYAKEQPVSMIKVECETCGEVFLEVLLQDYVEKSNSLNLSTLIPDRWFCKAILHWHHNQEHSIKFKSVLNKKLERIGVDEVLKFPENLSELFKEINEHQMIKTKDVINYYKEVLKKFGSETQI